MKTVLLSTHDYVAGEIILVKPFKMTWCGSIITQLTDYEVYYYHICITSSVFHTVAVDFFFQRSLLNVDHPPLSLCCL